MKTPFQTALLLPLFLSTALAQTPEPEPARLAELAVEGGELLLHGPAGHPGVLLIGAAVANPLPARGARLEVAPLEVVRFALDAEGEARVAVPRAALREEARIQMLVFDETHSHAIATLPARELVSLAAQASASTGSITSASSLGSAGSFGQKCLTLCTTCDDTPDADHIDSNCDGIDGDISRAFFVDEFSGTPAGPGTMGAPFSDLQYAIDLAAATPGIDHVYVSFGFYAGPIHLVEGVSVWGGFAAHDGWSRETSQVTTIHNLNSVTTAEGMVGLYGANIHAPTVVGDLEVEVWGGGLLFLGGNEDAIGIHLYDVSELTLERVTARGAHASGGDMGANGGTGTTKKSGGAGGAAGTKSSLPKSGGIGSGSSCGLGGPGGLGGAPYFGGFNGVGGIPGLPGAWGSVNASYPSISGKLLHTNGTGNNGSSGCPGGGGGGGGGAGYAPFLSSGKGGTGGKGGSQGYGGKGGKPGGTSVGLFLSQAQVTAIDCTFTADHGGIGGLGGIGGAGTGGSAGSKGQLVSGPDGGDGGTGGLGGLGGHAGPGASGHCYGVVANSTSTVDLQGCTLQATDPGLPMVGIIPGVSGEAVAFKQL